MLKRILMFSLIAAAFLIADQVTKFLIAHFMNLGENKVVIDGFMNLVHVLNRGGAWGVGSSARPGLFTVVSIAAMILILIYVIKLEADENLIMVALAFVFGGAAGNLVDRVRMGAVIDFLDIYIGSYHWPAFNVADIAITVGAGLMILHILRSKQKYNIPRGEKDAA